MHALLLVAAGALAPSMLQRRRLQVVGMLLLMVWLLVLMWLLMLVRKLLVVVWVGVWVVVDIMACSRM